LPVPWTIVSLDGQDPECVTQSPLLQFLSELGVVPIAGVTQYHVIAQSPTSDLINDLRRQLPLPAKDDALRNARFSSPLRIPGPTLRQIQPPAKRRIPLFSNMRSGSSSSLRIEAPARRRSLTVITVAASALVLLWGAQFPALHYQGV